MSGHTRGPYGMPTPPRKAGRTAARTLRDAAAGAASGDQSRRRACWIVLSIQTSRASVASFCAIGCATVSAPCR